MKNVQSPRHGCAVPPPFTQGGLLGCADQREPRAANGRPYIINKCKLACIILLRRLDVNQNQAYLATTAAIWSNWASMSVTSLNWVRALSRFCSG